MNHWNNFCKPSQEENFSIIFGWKYYLKDFTMQEIFFQSFFYFSSSGRDFSPHLRVEILSKDFTLKNLFQDFFFFFDSVSFNPLQFWLYILFKRLYYVRTLFNFLFFFFYWESFTLSPSKPSVEFLG